MEVTSDDEEPGKQLEVLVDRLVQTGGSQSDETRSTIEGLIETLMNGEPESLLPPALFNTGDDPTWNETLFEQQYIRLAQCLYIFGAVPEFKGREDVGFDDGDFEGVPQRATLSMVCYKALFEKTCRASVNVPDGRKDLVCRLLLVWFTKALMLSAEHYEESLWTSEVSVRTSTKTRQMVLQCSCCDTVEDILCSPSPQSFLKLGLLGSMLSEIRPKLARETWKQYPAAKHVFSWCLFHVRSPHLSDNLDQVLPPSLLFVDDFQLEHKLLGLHCLQHIMDNTSRSELAWYNRADVIYEALQHQLYTHEPELLILLLPAILCILNIVEKSPQKTDSPRSEGKYDIIFRRILSDMELETKLMLRLVYAENLSQYISALGITVVWHFKHLFRILFSYMEMYDGPMEKTRLAILGSLKVTIQEAWPRIPGHCEEILKALLKLIYDMSSDKSATSQEIKDAVISEATECMILLRRAGGPKAVELLQSLDGAHTNTICDNSIQQALADVSCN